MDRGMRVGVRVDSSSIIGHGHAVRCGALATALTDAGHQVVVVSRDLPGHAGTQLTSLGLDVRWIPPGGGDIDDTDDARTTAAALGAADWVVVDHYGLGESWERSMRAETGAQILVVEDLFDRRHDADVVVDQNLAGPDRADLVPARAVQLLGPRYALLRPQFRATAAAQPGRADRVLVMFGGTDQMGLTLAVVDALVGAQVSATIDVIVTGANPDIRTLEARAAANDNVELGVDVHEMAPRMAQASVMIGAAGSTSWERCALGLPAITVSVAENQRRVAEAVAATGAALDLGALGEPTAARVATVATEIARHATALLGDPSRLVEMGRRARGVCDGAGAERVVDAMRSRRSGRAPAIAIRPADERDRDLLRAWRNDDATRAMSFDPDEVSAAHHDAWFDRVIADPARLIAVGVDRVDHDRPVGVVRVEPEGEIAVISIIVAPEARGRGVARRLIELASAAWFHRDDRPIRAQIKVSNPASRRAFEQAGFEIEAQAATSIDMIRRPVSHATG